jgi:hypothetical protein
MDEGHKWAWQRTGIQKEAFIHPDSGQLPHFETHTKSRLIILLNFESEARTTFRSQQNVRQRLLSTLGEAVFLWG